jgi:hypothetical protein
MYACKNDIKTSKDINTQIRKKHPKNKTQETDVKSKQNAKKSFIRI